MKTLDKHGNELKVGDRVYRAIHSEFQEREITRFTNKGIYYKRYANDGRREYPKDKQGYPNYKATPIYIPFKGDLYSPQWYTDNGDGTRTTTNILKKDN
jgi:hypothetical protein